ncbi:unnamed protein product [Choristocarpus tenellus]
MKLGSSVKAGLWELLTRPHEFVGRPEFRIILGVYFATYTTANTVATACKHNQVNPLWPRFVSTSLVNVGASVTKDMAFMRMFGIIQSGAMPISTLMLLGMRDSMTIAARQVFEGFFNFPGPVSRHLQTAVHMPPATADVAAQMSCPPLMQLASTPLYLLGLDLYNRSGATVAERTSFIRAEYWGTVAARVARIAPAYSIGGVVNKNLLKILGGTT